MTSYSGTVADPSIAKFIKGRKASGATFDPAVKPLKAGKTNVTLSNSDGGHPGCGLRHRCDEWKLRFARPR
ncbi:MAG: hypothetical protein WDM88_03295 [Galbitalea sp.]